MRHSNQTPQVHAGSMADIAFLLLIFFLVATTIPNDSGIARDLPKPCPPDVVPCTLDKELHNVLFISINEQGKIMVNDETLPIDKVKDKIKDYVDNNRTGNCDYCLGKGLSTASDHPTKAAISLATHRQTSYTNFIALQNELTAAYSELRARFARNSFQKKITDLTSEEIEATKKAYPFQLSEMEF